MVKHYYIIMDNEETLKVLQEFGLNEKEAKVYLASLELGLARVNEISKKTGIFRETTYGVIDSLMRKGLIGYVIKSGVKYFESADPEKLKSILKEKETLMNKALPYLESLQRLKTVKPKIELYEGKEGLKTVMDDILKTERKEILGITSQKNLEKILKFYFPQFIKKRVRLGINIKLLIDKKPITTKLLEFKRLPKNFEIETSNYVYGDRIAMISSVQEEPVGMIIENREIADTQRKMFNLLWSSL